MDLSSILFALTILHAGYLMQLCMRQPSQKQVSSRTESRLMWFVASPDNTLLGRVATICLSLHHALISLALSPTTTSNENSLLYTICPVPDNLDTQLFSWSAKTIWTLMLLYLASYVRFQAYAQLGTNFTYRLAVPDGLVTNGYYAYVRHPSYTGLFCVTIALQWLFLNPSGGPTCTGVWLGEGWIAQTGPIIGLSGIIWLIMTLRVAEEETMLEKEFGQKWREHCKRSKKFIPFVI